MTATWVDTDTDDVITDDTLNRAIRSGWAFLWAETGTTITVEWNPHTHNAHTVTYHQTTPETHRP